ANGVELDMDGVRKFKEDVANKSSKGIDFLFRKNKVERLHGHGRLAGPGKVSVTGADGKEQIVEAKHVVIATGSAPKMIPGLALGPLVMTSDELLENTIVPKRLIVLGVGAVGRRPVGENVGLEKFPAIKMERGFAVVDPATLLAGESWVSAIGDVVALPGQPHPQLAHLAFVEGEFVADKLAGKKPHPV